jgi:hypothetical protein
MRPVAARSSVCDTHPDSSRQFRATAGHGHIGRLTASSYTADRAGVYIFHPSESLDPCPAGPATSP